MKTLFKLIWSLPLLLLTTIAAGQNNNDYLGLPGDNLNLYAVMKQFQESPTLEDFERKINDPESNINNLDLNGDNQIDYINVKDYENRGVHTIVLSVALNERETQDVAVFTVMRDSRNNVTMQLVGDEALYGKNYIIEPIMNGKRYARTPNPGYQGGGGVVTYGSVDVEASIVLGAWPIIRWMFSPSYVVWHSPWRWGYYPNYWQPWRPYYWHYYCGFHDNLRPYYEAHYHYYPHFRHNYYERYYYNDHRNYSVTVIDRRNHGFYNSTYSRPELRREGEVHFNRGNGHSDSRGSVNNRSQDRFSRPSSVNRNENWNNGSRNYNNPVNRGESYRNNNSGSENRSWNKRSESVKESRPSVEGNFNRQSNSSSDQNRISSPSTRKSVAPAQHDRATRREERKIMHESRAQERSQERSSQPKSENQNNGEGRRR